MLDERNWTELLSTASVGHQRYGWASEIRTQCRIAPEQGICKINRDAAVDRANSDGAIAAVCRGSNAGFVAASAMTIRLYRQILRSQSCSDFVNLVCMSRVACMYL